MPNNGRVAREVVQWMRPPQLRNNILILEMVHDRKKVALEEFQLGAINLVLEQGYSRAEAARSLEINANMPGRWIKEYEADEGQLFRGNGKLTAERKRSDTSLALWGTSSLFFDVPVKTG